MVVVFALVIAAFFRKNALLQRPEVCWNADKCFVYMCAAYFNGFARKLLRPVLGSGRLSLTPLLFLRVFHFK